METNEGPPMEEREEEEYIPEEEENRPRSRFRDNQDFLDFLDDFNELRENEERNIEDENLHLPTTDPIRLKTIENLKKIREEDYPILFEKYLLDEQEVKKVIANKDKYTQFNSENEDVRVFIELSKNISQLEKGISTEDSMEAMYVFGDYQDEPRAKKFRERLIEFFKKRKNTYLFLIGGTFVIALSGVVVAIEEGLKKLKSEVEKRMYKKYLEVRDEIENKIKDEVKETKDNIKKDVMIVSQKKVEYTLLSLLNTILHKILEYIFGILVFFVVSMLYYKYGRKT